LETGGAKIPFKALHRRSLSGREKLVNNNAILVKDSTHLMLNNHNESIQVINEHSSKMIQSKSPVQKMTTLAKKAKKRNHKVS
jgi:hypothetical protein